MDRTRLTRAAGGTLVATFLVASAVLGADALTRPASPAGTRSWSSARRPRPRPSETSETTETYRDH